MTPEQLGAFIREMIQEQVAKAGTVTEYREPLVGFARADDPRFAELRQHVHPSHMLPDDLLSGARSLVSFFLPFAPWVLEANARYRDQVARQWAVAYVETNHLLARTAAHLVERLAQHGIRAMTEAVTQNFDRVTLTSRWSHKSVGVIAGIGSFGLQHLVITDAGCAGRFSSVVLDAPLPEIHSSVRERCLYFHDGSCLECVARCPANALDPAKGLDKQLCSGRCQEVGRSFPDLDLAEVCGKCAIGPCSFSSAVPEPAI